MITIKGRSTLSACAVGWLAASGLLVAQTPAAAPPDGKAAFARLKTLVGDWEGHTTTPDGPAARVEFRLAGNGSALVERLFPGTDHEMLSVYHLVGDELVLTHYCAMGNQPRMKLVQGGAAGELQFDFAGGDNVDARKGTHMHAGRFASVTNERYEADWTVVSDGRTAGSNRFFMSRTTARPQ